MRSLSSSLRQWVMDYSWGSQYRENSQFYRQGRLITTSKVVENSKTVKSSDVTQSLHLLIESTGDLQEDSKIAVIQDNFSSSVGKASIC